uniref:Lck interacting transmembrane adaptor 1 n=1 Tax=Astyanax mexicanus TaxID=7994 RepID=A0A8B9LNX3_ASTMX
MASMQDGVNFTAPPYGKVLLLGAIAAASAFVVTILIVVLCVGCQRKGKSHNGTGEERKHRLMDMVTISFTLFVVMELVSFCCVSVDWENCCLDTVLREAVIKQVVH